MQGLVVAAMQGLVVAAMQGLVVAAMQGLVVAGACKVRGSLRFLLASSARQ